MPAHDNTAPPKTGKAKSILFAAFYLAPAAVFLFVDRHEAVARLVVVGALLTLGQILLVRSAVDPRVHLIKPGGKLFNSPHKGRAEFVLRAMCGILALILTFYVAVPLWIDTSKWVSHKADPRTITAKVVDNHMVFGTWFLCQTLSIDGPGSDRQQFYLFYSPKPVKVGQTYEITVLEQSRIVLAAHRR